MEETLVFPKIAEIDLIKNLEKISSNISIRIINLEGFHTKRKSQRTIRNIYFKRFQ